MNLSVRKARMGDIRAIHALLMTSSADGLLLPRSLTDLYGHLRDFFVVEGDGATVGCGALSIIWENMAEVRSLAVADAVGLLWKPASPKPASWTSTACLP